MAFEYGKILICVPSRRYKHTKRINMNEKYEIKLDLLTLLFVNFVVIYAHVVSTIKTILTEIISMEYEKLCLSFLFHFNSFCYPNTTI